MFYLAAYGFCHPRCLRRHQFWFVKMAVKQRTCPNWAGLGKRSPVLGPVPCRCLCFPSPASPLTSGFIGKFTVFEAAILADAVPLGESWGVIASIIAAFFYVRVIVSHVLH